jgi:hypothetical protein
MTRLGGEYTGLLVQDKYFCQYFAPRRRVICDLFKLEVLDTNFGVTVSADMALVRIEYDWGVYSYYRLGSTCPPDFTSLPGGNCVLYYPWNQGRWGVGHYITSDGIAHVCEKPECLLGWTPGYCTRTTPAECVMCLENTTLPAGTNFRYTTLETCQYEILPPCPPDMYANDDGVCQTCPPLRHTNGTSNSTSIEACVCVDSLVPVADGNCVIPTGGTLFLGSNTYGCSGAEFFDVVDRQCRNCRDLPCVIPPAGKYTESCYGELLDCVIPANAIAIQTDLQDVDPLTNQPGMCDWVCLQGYVRTGNLCESII